MSQHFCYVLGCAILQNRNLYFWSRTLSTRMSKRQHVMQQFYKLSRSLTVRQGKGDKRWRIARWGLFTSAILQTLLKLWAFGSNVWKSKMMTPAKAEDSTRALFASIGVFIVDRSPSFAIFSSWSLSNCHFLPLHSWTLNASYKKIGVICKRGRTNSKNYFLLDSKATSLTLPLLMILPDWHCFYGLFCQLSRPKQWPQDLPMSLIIFVR